MMTYPHVSTLCVLLLLTACPKDDPGTSQGDASTGSTSAVTTPTGDMDDTAETGATGGASVCAEACAHLFECDNKLLAPSVSGCINLCEAAALTDTEWCHSAAQDWYACLGAAPCDDMMPGPTGTCAVAFADYSVSCTPCAASIEPDTADRCFATAECTGAFAVTFACEGDTCTCNFDGESFKTCPAAGACATDDAAIQAAAEACCEMPFTPAVPPGG